MVMDPEEKRNVQWPQQLLQPITHSMVRPSVQGMTGQMAQLPQDDAMNNMIPLGTVKTEPADPDYEQTLQVKLYLKLF